MEFKILENLLLGFVDAVPKVFGALMIALLGYIIAKVISKVIKTILSKSGVDRLADYINQIDIVRQANIELVPSGLLSKVSYYLILIIFFVAATDVLDMPAVSDLMTDILNYVPFILSAGIVLAIGTFLADYIQQIVRSACEALGVPSAKIISMFAFWFVFLTALVSALSQAQIDTSFITSNLSIIVAGGVGAFAIGYGLASKSTMANFLASFYARDRFNIGDVVTIGKIKGEIIDMNKGSLTIQSSADPNNRTIVPLSILQTEAVELHTAPSA